MRFLNLFVCLLTGVIVSCSDEARPLVNSGRDIEVLPEHPEHFDLVEIPNVQTAWDYKYGGEDVLSMSRDGSNGEGLVIEWKGERIRSYTQLSRLAGASDAETPRRELLELTILVESDTPWGEVNRVLEALEDEFAVLTRILVRLPDGSFGCYSLFRYTNHLVPHDHPMIIDWNIFTLRLNDRAEVLVEDMEIVPLGDRSIEKRMRLFYGAYNHSQEYDADGDGLPDYPVRDKITQAIAMEELEEWKQYRKQYEAEELDTRFFDNMIAQAEEKLMITELMGTYYELPKVSWISMRIHDNAALQEVCQLLEIHTRLMQDQLADLEEDLQLDGFSQMDQALIKSQLVKSKCALDGRAVMLPWKFKDVGELEDTEPWLGPGYLLYEEEPPQPAPVASPPPPVHEIEIHEDEEHVRDSI